MKTLKVRFSGDGVIGRTYDYMTDIDSVEKGSRVVVDSPNGGYVVVEVTEVVDTETVKASKWVVCLVDDTRYKQRLAADTERKDILALLEKKSRKIEEVQKYEFLSALDPEAAALLSRLKEIANG